MSAINKLHGVEKLLPILFIFKIIVVVSYLMKACHEIKKLSNNKAASVLRLNICNTEINYLVKNLGNAEGIQIVSNKLDS